MVAAVSHRVHARAPGDKADIHIVGGHHGPRAGEDDAAETKTTNLELHRLTARSIEHVGSLKIGEESSRKHFSMSDGYPGSSNHIEGTVASYTHVHGAAGEDCLRIERPRKDQSSLSTPGRENRSSRELLHRFVMGRIGPAAVRQSSAPSRLPLKEGFYRLPGPPKQSKPDESAGAAGETEPDLSWDTHRITIVPLEGLWRIEADALSRVSPDARGSCTAPP